MRWWRSATARRWSASSGRHSTAAMADRSCSPTPGGSLRRLRRSAGRGWKAPTAPRRAAGRRRAATASRPTSRRGSGCPLPSAPLTAEAYDAVVLIALAAAAAGTTTDSEAIRDALREVANPPGEVVGPGVAEIARALDLIAADTAVNYEGVAGSNDFDAHGDVVTPVEIWSCRTGRLPPPAASRRRSAAAAGRCRYRPICCGNASVGCATAQSTPSSARERIDLQVP